MARKSGKDGFITTGHNLRVGMKVLQPDFPTPPLLSEQTQRRIGIVKAGSNGRNCDAAWVKLYTSESLRHHRRSARLARATPSY